MAGRGGDDAWRRAETLATARLRRSEGGPSIWPVGRVSTALAHCQSFNHSLHCLLGGLQQEGTGKTGWCDAMRCPST